MDRKVVRQIAPGIVLCMALAISGCRTTIQVTATPAPAPTELPTPVSTPLPPVPTLEAFGFSTERAFVLTVQPDANSDSTTASLTDALTDKIRVDDRPLMFKVQIANRAADVIEALCSTTPSFAWADGWAMLVAKARGCGTPVLKITRENQSGVSADVIVGDSTEIRALDQARGATFCRLSEDDITGWILPAILLRSAPNFDPTRDLTVRPVPDRAALLREVAQGNCIGAVLHGSLPARSGVRILGVTPTLPFGGLVIGSRVPAEAALRVTRFFQDQPRALQGLIAADKLVVVNAAEFSGIEGLLSTAGIDLATLGN